MTARYFLDTNILVYAHDRSEPEKQRTAIKVMDRLLLTGSAVISAQVLSEFVNAVTRRIAAPLSMPETLAQVERLNRVMPVLPVTAFVVLEAVRGASAYSMSFWDAQIWAAARMNQIPVVLSEDFSSGSSIEGVRFLNPLDSSFVLTQSP